MPYYVFPLLCLLVAVISQYSGLDIRLGQLFYDAQQNLWPYRSSWLTKDVLHDGAHDVIVLIFISMFFFFIATLFNTRLKKYRRISAYILLASLSGFIIVGILKSTTHMYTPWDLQMFGGQYPNIRLFDSVAENLPVGHAFPAGHASGGYALLSFFFAARQHQHRYSLYLLYGAMFIGLLLGIDQQVRGAHLLSHDLFTVAICWFACIFWSMVFFPATKPVETTVAQHAGYGVKMK